MQSPNKIDCVVSRRTNTTFKNVVEKISVNAYDRYVILMNKFSREKISGDSARNTDKKVKKYDIEVMKKQKTMTSNWTIAY